MAVAEPWRTEVPSVRQDVAIAVCCLRDNHHLVFGLDSRGKLSQPSEDEEQAATATGRVPMGEFHIVSFLPLLVD